MASELDDPTMATRVGRIRAPTPTELAEPMTMIRADAVLSIHATDAELPPLERHVGSFIDGFRPVARVKQKSGLTTDDVVTALRALLARGLITLVGVVEDANDIAFEVTAESEVSKPAGAADVIPPHIMREIDLMLREEDELRRREAAGSDPEFAEFEDEATPTATTTPPDDER